MVSTKKNGRSSKKLPPHRGIGHGVLSDISRSEGPGSCGPRPFTRADYLKRYEEKAAVIGRRLVGNWQKYAQGVLDEAIEEKYLLERREGLSVTPETRDKYRDARKEVRNGGLLSEEKELAFVLNLAKKMAPDVRKTKAQLLAQWRAYRARSEPQRQPAPLHMWSSASTVSVVSEDGDADAEGEVDDNDSVASDHSDATEVAGPAATPMRRINPAASYPTPASTRRPSRELMAHHPAPVTPTRSGSHREAGPSQFELNSSPLMPNRILGLQQGHQQAAGDNGSDTLSEGSNIDAAGDEEDAEADDYAEALLIEILELDQRLDDERKENARLRENANMVEGMRYQLQADNNRIAMMEQQLHDLRQQYTGAFYELYNQKEQMVYQLERQKEHEAGLANQLVMLNGSLAECQRQAGVGQQNEQALFTELHRVQGEKLHADAEVQRLNQEVAQLGQKVETARQQMEYYIQYDMQLADAFMQNAQQAQMVFNAAF